ncbi:MAG: tetratricopeptide repeat protein [Rhodospirillaceae bacterium]
MRKVLLISAAMFAFASAPALAATGKAASQPTSKLSPTPDTQNPSHTYEVCLMTAKNEPEKGFEMAGKWMTLGGGPPAKHCEAIALIGMKEYSEAATRLEALAKLNEEESVKAGVLSQAGQAWLLQGDLTRALAAQTQALEAMPVKNRQHANILVDRAATYADAGKYSDAVLDLDASLAIEPKNPDALAFRASARRHLNDVDVALVDAEQSVALDPHNIIGLLERGIIYRMKKRDNDARQDWLRIIQIAPDSEAGKAARTNIERMDVLLEAEAKANQ